MHKKRNLTVPPPRGRENPLQALHLQALWGRTWALHSIQQLFLSSGNGTRVFESGHLSHSPSIAFRPMRQAGKRKRELGMNDEGSSGQQESVCHCCCCCCYCCCGNSRVEIPAAVAAAMGGWMPSQQQLLQCALAKTTQLRMLPCLSHNLLRGPAQWLLGGIGQGPVALRDLGGASLSEN